MEGASASSYQRFEIPGIARLTEGNGGLPAVRVTAPDATGEIYLHGAHVTSWKPVGAQEVLFVSAKSRWDSAQAIRGGIPICFPWFGGKSDNPQAPSHGFARTMDWQLESITQSGGAVAVSMLLESNADTKKWSPTDFRLLYRVTFGRELLLELQLSNLGKSPLRFEEALHAYYHVGDIEKTATLGLEGCHYLDKTDANQKKLQQGEIVIGAETDRVYLDTRADIEIDDPILQRRIRIEKQHSRNTVVWNPWIKKSLAFSDFGADEWKHMICIEPSNVGEFAIELAPGQQHTLQTRTSVTSPTQGQK